MLHTSCSSYEGTGFLLHAWLLGGCASLPDRSNISASYVLEAEQTASTYLAQVTQARLSETKEDNLFYLMPGGLDAFASRLVLTESAEKSIDIQSFLLKEDSVGMLLARYILKAADRGVRVRLLLDDIGNAWGDDNLRVLAMHPNVECRVFNPASARGLGRGLSYVADLRRILRRMHNKLVVVDEHMAIIGGRNLAEEYFAYGPRYFSDMDTLVMGSIVAQSAAVFDQYWNHQLASPIESFYDNELPSPPMQQRFFDQLDELAKGQSAQRYLDKVANSGFVQAVQNRSVELFSGGRN